MGCIRPATPGFIATLIATILLAVVSFCVPFFKSVFFLKADATVSGQNATITFGTLGYCFELNGNVNCSKPSVGYELDINSLVGNKTPIEIPQVAVKWITYVLVLHIVALVFAAGSAVFGLLAHVREMSMMCCSTCVSGFAAVAALLAFIFDLALFFIAKARINAIGKATIGNAIWLTLAAWVLLFFSGCFYTLGRCCISKRGPRDKGKGKNEYGEGPGGNNTSRDMYAEQMRMDAVKAEQARKNNHKEVGLPAFQETLPLTARVEGDSVYTESYSDNVPVSPRSPHSPRQISNGGYVGGGYMQQPASNRAVDEYYHPSIPPATSYPPEPRRQASFHSYATSNYPPPQPPVTSPPLPNPNNQYLAAGPRTTTPGREYGHTVAAAGGSTYYSAHDQHPSSYSQYDMYGGQSDPYAQATSPAQRGYNSHATSYYTPAATPGAVPDRTYTLGGDGYGANSVPPLQQRSPSVPSIPDHPATAGYIPFSTSPPPNRSQAPPAQSYDDNPPGYEAETSGIPGAWGKH